AALAVTCAAKLETAQDATTAAADLAVTALQHYRELVARRSAGAAGILAAELRSGEPCAVCGSREHPEPATAGKGEGEGTGEGEGEGAEQGIVDSSEAALAAAQAVSDAAYAALDGARHAEQEASSLLAAARAAAGSRTVDEAEAARAQAKSAHAAASAAAEE